MTTFPKDYVGKAVKMRGQFSTDGSFSYPEDYPELGDQITVVGTFEKCTQDGLEFYRLSQAEMVAA